MGHPHRHVVRVLSLSCNCFQHLLQDESLAQNFAVNLSQGHREHKSLLIGEVGINVNLLFLFFCKKNTKQVITKTTMICFFYQQGIYLLPIYYRTQSIIQLPKGLNSIRMQFNWTLCLKWKAQQICSEMKTVADNASNRAMIYSAESV